MGAVALAVLDWVPAGLGRVARHALLVYHQAQDWEAIVELPVRWVGIRSNHAIQSRRDDRALRGRHC